MSEQEIDMSKVQDHGKLLGELSPSKDSKGSWSELYYFEGKLVCIIYADTQDCWSVGAHYVNEDDIDENVDEPERAKYVLEQHRNQISETENS